MNSKLYGNEYRIPDKILNYINKKILIYSNHEGVKRGKNLLKSKTISYSSLKRIKNFYDDYEKKGGDKIKYELSGGDLMKDFIEQTLKKERKKTDIYNKTTKDIRTNNNIHESLNYEKTNVLCVIFNSENKVLLLKRSSYEDQWEPNKWCLPGGGVEENENTLQAINREIEEETGLNINNYLSSFSIMRDKNNIENVFICRYNGSDEDVELDYEHSGYGWFSPSEINFLNVVPNLTDYISIAITKY